MKAKIRKLVSKPANKNENECDGDGNLQPFLERAGLFGNWMIVVKQAADDLFGHAQYCKAKRTEGISHKKADQMNSGQLCDG